MIPELSERSREIFRQIVEAYVETGEPVGSQLLSQRLSMGLSSASIRSVMADLQEAGLLYSPHTSAGRLPTASGLRFFVDGLLEVGEGAPAILDKSLSFYVGLAGRCSDIQVLHINRVLFNECLLHSMQCAIGGLYTLDRYDCFAFHIVR